VRESENKHVSNNRKTRQPGLHHQVLGKPREDKSLLGTDGLGSRRNKKSLDGGPRPTRRGRVKMANCKVVDCDMFKQILVEEYLKFHQKHVYGRSLWKSVRRRLPKLTFKQFQQLIRELSKTYGAQKIAYWHGGRYDEYIVTLSLDEDGRL